MRNLLTSLLFATGVVLFGATIPAFAQDTAASGGSAQATADAKDSTSVTPLKKERPRSRAIEQENGSWIVFYTCQAEAPAELIARVNELSPFWQPLDPEAKMFVNTKQRKITITGKLPAVQKIERFLSEFDVPSKQVKIDVRIVEVSYSSDLEFGFELLFDYLTKDAGSFLKAGRSSFFPVDFTGNFPTTTFPAAGGPNDFGTFIFRRARPTYNFDAAVAALKKNGRAEILSEPSVTVAAGQTAIFKSVDNVPRIETSVTGANSAVSVVTVFQEIGIQMSVTPSTIGKDIVYLSLNPKVEAITGTSSTVSAGVAVDNPIFSTRQITTQLSVRDGQIVVMGGLLSKSIVEDESKIPILGDIPILGQLFSKSSKSTQKRELIFMLTPHIIDPNASTPNVPKLVIPKIDLPDVPDLPDLP